MDDLKKVYAIAQDAADNFSGKVSYYQSENDSLLEVNDTLNSRMGRLAILRVADLFITPQREKKDEFIPTFKASKVENLKINFTLLPSNAIAPGEKDLIVRIVGPGGVVLLENLNTLRDSDELYSMEHTVNYTGKEQKVNLTYTQEAEYRSGNYSLELYQNGQLLDRISFTLD
ncbi:hypothetical protein GYB22_01965 [bacterium]|nr:hypothetical protein [bacterium]